MRLDSRARRSGVVDAARHGLGVDPVVHVGRRADRSAHLFEARGRVDPQLHPVRACFGGSRRGAGGRGPGLRWCRLRSRGWLGRHERRRRDVPRSGSGVACDAVAVAIEFPAVAGLSYRDRRCPRCACLVAVAEGCGVGRCREHEGSGNPTHADGGCRYATYSHVRPPRDYETRPSTRARE